MKQRKKTASSYSGFKFSKQNTTGKRLDVVTAEEYKEQHTGKEIDLQKAVADLCGLFGWIRMGMLTKLDSVIPQDCPGVWFHVPGAAYRAGGSVGSNLKNCPDVMLLRRDGKFLGLELKTKKGRQSPGQKILSRIIPVKLIKSCDHAEEEIKKFTLT